MRENSSKKSPAADLNEADRADDNKQVRNGSKSADDSECVIKTENLSVGYKNKKIISDLNLSVKKGEIITLIGSNGCGKSTLLRTLAGQQKALGGNIFISDREIREYNETELAKKLSILLTDRVMPLLMTAYDVVCSGRYPYTGRLGILSAEDHEKVEEVMELTGITGLRDELFSELSDGQRQRVMLARALSQEPDILIMDEPMTFLDIKYKRELSDIIKKLRDEKNLSMIISLHELHIIKRFTDRVVCVKDGRIDKTGTPDEIVEDNYIDYLFDMA